MNAPRKALAAAGVVLILASGCGRSDARSIGQEDVVSAFRKTGLEITEVRVPLFIEGVSYTHFPDGGGEADLIVSVWESESDAASYVDQFSGHLVPSVRSLTREHNVVLQINVGATSAVQGAAEEALRMIGSL